MAATFKSPHTSILPQCGTFTSDQFPARTIIWKWHTAKGHLVILFYKNTNQTGSQAQQQHESTNRAYEEMFCTAELLCGFSSVKACCWFLCSGFFTASIFDPHPLLTSME